jgi:hypothetical protein
MHAFSQHLPSLPGFAGPKTYASWPVWKCSVREEVRFQPMPKKQAVQLWHKARKFDRSTKLQGKHGGLIGHAGLQVLHALIFDFLNYRTGRLDPSYEGIARKANLARSTVAEALRRLKQLGVINWLRRCVPISDGGRFELKQETNAYAVLPASQWSGFRDEQPPPLPSTGTWGDHPPMPDVFTQAATAHREGDGLAGMVARLEDDPTDQLAAAVARIGRHIMGANS